MLEVDDSDSELDVAIRMGQNVGAGGRVRVGGVSA